jgi:hypothetical protein
VVNEENSFDCTRILGISVFSPWINGSQSVPEKQTKVPAKATPITTSKFKRPDTQRRWQSEDVESSDSFISDEDEADTRGYSGVSSMIREMFRYSSEIPDVIIWVERITEIITC